MSRLFGTDGIRGVANTYPMDVETASQVGRAVACYFLKNACCGSILVGQDTRVSGDMLAQAVAAGVCSAGANVEYLGILPTPAVAYLTATRNALAGIMISASHNPFDDNGIKIIDPNGYKLTDNIEERIEALMEGAAEPCEPASGRRIGRIKHVDAASALYLDFLQATTAHLSLQGLNIVLDCANGATYEVAPELFRRLGAKVNCTFCAPNGTNINEDCGSQHPQHLAHAVLAHKADVGLAFDGDGDRLIAVDEQGKVLTGDQIMLVCIRDMLTKGMLKKKVVVSTVMSNLGFRKALGELGIQHYTTQVGDRYVLEKMIQEEALLGGEDSGHIIFRDRHTTGDGLMAALRLTEAMCSSRQPLSRLSTLMTVFPQQLVNVKVSRKPDLAAVPEIAQAIAAAEKALGEKGRILVRYSGTEPKCRIMVEGLDHKQITKICNRLADIVGKHLGN